MRQVSIELTENCNFHCIHCYMKMRENRTFKAMPFEDYCKILDWDKNNQVLFLTLTGGEPLLLSDFTQYYERAINEGFIVSVLTNVSMLTETAIQSLRKYPPRTVEISIYGMSNTIYQIMTGNGDAFHRVFSNIERLSDCNIPFILKYVVTSVNYNEIPLFIAWAESHCITYNLNIANLPIQIYNSSGWTDRSFRITHDQLVELSVKYPSKISILPIGSRAACDLGHLLHFTASGRIQGCPALPAAKYQAISGSEWDKLILDYVEVRDKCMFCPAWEQVENLAEISKFLYGIPLK